MSYFFISCDLGCPDRHEGVVESSSENSARSKCKNYCVDNDLEYDELGGVTYTIASGNSTTVGWKCYCCY